MKILLATTVNNLAEKFAVLSPELEYCALVTDKRELAKEILDKLDLSNVPLYPMSELKTCFENLIYDYIFCVQDVPYGTGIVSILQKYKIPTEKVMSFSIAGNWQTEFLIRYYQTHAKDFEMFATGTSYTEAGVDIRKFKRNTINFATSSQDLYYSFQIAKSVVLCGRGIARYDMPSSDLRHMFFTSTFQRHLYLRRVFCLILLPLTIYIISPCLSTFIKIFSAKNG